MVDILFLLYGIVRTKWIDYFVQFISFVLFLRNYNAGTPNAIDGIVADDSSIVQQLLFSVIMIF